MVVANPEERGGNEERTRGNREKGRLAVGEERGTAEENAEVEVEEDNIDPLVAPPLLARPTPSLYYPPSLRLSDICAHLRPRNPTGPLVHARPRASLFSSKTLSFQRWNSVMRAGGKGGNIQSYSLARSIF